MKILVINSSYRTNGNTALALNAFAKRLVERGNDVHWIDLARRNIGMCRGCRICFDKGEDRCPHNDDVLEIRRDIGEADLTILGSPIYVEDVNGVMKNWIDRMAFVCHRPEFFAKRAYVVCTSGVGSSNHAPSTITKALSLWGFSVIGQSKFITGAKMGEAEFEGLYERRVRTEVQKIERHLSNRPRAGFLGLLIFGIQRSSYRKSPETDSVDYLYWKNRGWLGKGVLFDPAVKTSRVKAAIARALGLLVEKIVLG